MSESIEALRTLANEAHAAGRLADAETLAKRILAQDSADAKARLLMGVIAGKSGRPELAAEYFRSVLEIDTKSFESLFWLSMLHRRTKEYKLATEYAERAVEVRPNDAHGLNNLGLSYLDQVRLDEAALTFRRAVSIRTDFPQIFHNLGTTLYLLGRDMEAARALDQALLLSPSSVESFLGLGQVLLSQTNPGEAAKCARRAINLNPKSAEAHLLMASALVEDSRTADAEVHMKRAIELDPQDPKAHGLLGQRYQSLGQFKEANEHLQKSLEIEPHQGFAYFAYVHNNKITESDRPLVKSMEHLIVEGGLDPRQTNFLEYGLGRAFESLGEYEKAMMYFDRANRTARKLKFGDQVFDRDRYARDFDWLIKTFSADFLEANRHRGIASDVPIVIVGMMRSGTTLAEQILSSHPLVGAAGEQRFWPLSRPTIFGRDGRAMNTSALLTFARPYVDLLKKIAPGAKHITDKMPANYEYLGAILTALPNARLIHMRRNPVDTCISIYATPNRVPIDYAYDRENIVFAYEQYLRLMEHWRLVLPPDRFIEVNYEDVVADREKEARRMLELVGLEWDEALLSHEKNQRNVNTPSLWQVRQPIYTTSVERWRRYEPWLGAFRKLLVEK